MDWIFFLSDNSATEKLGPDIRTKITGYKEMVKCLFKSQIVLQKNHKLLPLKYDWWRFFLYTLLGGAGG